MSGASVWLVSGLRYGWVGRKAWWKLGKVSCLAGRLWACRASDGWARELPTLALTEQTLAQLSRSFPLFLFAFHPSPCLSLPSLYQIWASITGMSAADWAKNTHIISFWRRSIKYPTFLCFSDFCSIFFSFFLHTGSNWSESFLMSETNLCRLCISRLGMDK